MNNNYFIVLLVGLVLCAVLYAFLLRRAKHPLALSPVTAVLSPVLAFVFAKLVYFLLMLGHDWRQYGFGGLLLFDFYQFSFFGGCLGAFLGACLSAALFRRPVLRVLDAFAPVLALGIAFARGAEYFLDEVNIPADELENAALRFFPLAVTNEYEEWYVALFMISALLALVVCVVFLLRRKENAVPGLRMERVIFYLCLPQIMMESLRIDSIKWGFVRPEQILCAVAMLIILIRGCGKTRVQGFFNRYMPVILMFISALIIIFVEFNLDKTFLDISPLADYLLMALALVIMALGEILLFRRRLAQTEPEPRKVHTYEEYPSH